MKRHISVIFLVLTLVLTIAAKNQNKSEKRFDDLSAKILRDLQVVWPVHASEMGVHTYDTRFPDYSPGAVRDAFDRFRNHLVALHRLNESNLPADKVIDIHLLKSNCEMAVLTLDRLKYFRSNPNLYLNDAADGLHYILIGIYPSKKEQLDHILGRMKALPEYLRQAETNLKMPPPLWLDYAKQNAPRIISFYRDITTALVSENPVRRHEIEDASQLALAALERFAKSLETVLPGDPKSFAVGKEYFDYILTHDHLFTFDSDSLLKIGERLLADVQRQYDSTKQEGEKAGAKPQIETYAPSSLSKQEVLDYYNWEVAAVKKFLTDSNIITIPTDVADCKVMETPPYLRGTIGGIAYQQAGPFTPGAAGLFYVRPIPDSLSSEQRDKYFRTISQRGFRGSVVHEAYPGHHLQLQLATRSGSDVRKWQMNNCLIEGWALYCEEMMTEVGLFPDEPGRRLGVLGGIRFRAARIIVDVKLHTGQFDYDQAVKWMTETLSTDSTYIKSEVLRYTMSPTQPMSYLIGKREISALRDRMKASEGSAFSLKSFHDRLLSEGSIPISLIERVLMH